MHMQARFPKQKSCVSSVPTEFCQEESPHPKTKAKAKIIFYYDILFGIVSSVSSGARATSSSHNGLMQENAQINAWKRSSDGASRTGVTRAAVGLHRDVLDGLGGLGAGSEVRDDVVEGVHG